MWFSLHDITKESGKGADEDVGTRRDALLPIRWSQDVIYQLVKKADFFFLGVTYAFSYGEWQLRSCCRIPSVILSLFFPSLP